MGVPMVQKQTQRRSSLIMGAVLALLLGVAAGFFILAMPIRMLETITTFTRLSKLMVYAEPPLSPNDRNVLAVLAGILTAGMGWVLIDWLLFGRAGMRTLIREREDDYEDEDGDSFRPTDPLDLVSPVPLPSGEWAPPPTGDARRPLSARTDIGDPPKPIMPQGVQPALMPGIDQLLPPIDQILAGAGGAAPPLQPGMRAPSPGPVLVPDPFRPGAQPLSGDIWGVPETPMPDSPPAGPPLDPPMPEQFAPSAAGWLPTPGVRPDGSQARFEIPAPPPLEIDRAEAIAPEPSAAPIAAPAPLPPASPPLQPIPAEPAPVPPPPRVAPEQVFAPPAPAFATPQQVPVESPTPVAPPRVQQPDRPSTLPLLPEPDFDKARLEDLLLRLERGLKKRREAAALAARVAPAPAPPAIEPQPRPIEPPSFAAEPPRAAPPAGYAAPRPDPFAFPQPTGSSPPQPVISPPVMPTTAPAYALPPMPSAPTYDPAPLSPAGQPSSVRPSQTPVDEPGDALLDQPLHMTLDMLRNRVKQ